MPTNIRCYAWNSSPGVLDFVGSAQACPLAYTASACPDHIVRTKHYPLSLEWDGQSVAELEAQIPHAVRHYCEAYQAYFEAHRTQAVLVRGYFLVARAAFRLWQAQGIGGNLVFITSKNALLAGKGAVAYSAAKASELHMARCLAEEGGAFGIRVNSIAPDAVLQGSRIWESAWRAARARAYGVASDQLEAYYRERTTLKVNATPEDVAEAVLFFASDRSAKTTGAVLCVDGGVLSAYPR